MNEKVCHPQPDDMGPYMQARTLALYTESFRLITLFRTELGALLLLCSPGVRCGVDSRKIILHVVQMGCWDE